MHDKRISKGYFYIYRPESSGASMSESYRGYIFEHRAIMEMVIGRSLNSDEDVHHIDKNKKNNSPENLIVLTKYQHQKLHKMWHYHPELASEALTKEGIIKIVNSDYKQHCVECGKQLSRSIYNKRCAERCSYCSHIKSRKTLRPSKEELETLILHNNYVDLEKKFGVSTAAIKKWMKAYGIEAPHRRGHYFHLCNRSKSLNETRIQPELF